MKRTVLTFGVMAGIVIFAYTYLVFMILGDFSTMTPKDLEMAGWLGYLRYLVLLLGITMAMVTYRKNAAGPIGYGRAFTVGLMVAMITAVFVGVMEYVYIAFTNPDFYGEYTRLVVESMKAKGATAAELEAERQNQASYAWMVNPFATGVFYFFETSVIGAIFSLIAAAFTRRKEGPSETGSPALNQLA